MKVWKGSTAPAQSGRLRLHRRHRGPRRGSRDRRGPEGPQGETGPQGDPGIEGPLPGSAGPQGDPGPARTTAVMSGPTPPSRSAPMVGPDQLPRRHQRRPEGGAQRRLACSSVITATLDSAGNVGAYTSVTVGADGLGLISYRDATNGDLRVAPAQTWPAPAPPPPSLTAPVSRSTLHLDHSGGRRARPDQLLLQRRPEGGALRNVACSSATTAILDGARVGTYSSVTVGADGLGLISYRDDYNGDLEVAHCANVACPALPSPPLTAPVLSGPTPRHGRPRRLGLISYQTAPTAT